MTEAKFGRTDDSFPSSGITLVETLVSVAVLVILLAAVFSIHHTVSTTLSYQQRHWRAWEPTASAMDTIVRDLRCCSRTSATGGQFALSFDERTACSSLAIESLSAQAGPTNDLANAPLCRIRYWVQPPDEQHPTGALVREVALAGVNSQAPALHVLTENILLFAVAVFDGKKWTNTWLLAKTGNIPKAARITLSCGDDTVTNTITTATLIPAGMTIRRGSNAPPR